uniref:Adhesion G-protein coupled receptor G2 n=1 Tax=Scophthalmus maximus TaxID=52904 RepID=A0A8D3AKQ4_SCOMX
MPHGDEDKVMEASRIYTCGSLFRQMFTASVRMKRTGPRVRHLHWWQILLVLLAAPSSCIDTSAALSLPTPPLNTSALYYHVYVTVDVTGPPKTEPEIQHWVSQVFGNNLENCLSPSPTETITSLPKTSSASTSDGTTLMTTATTATTTLQSNWTTAAAATTLQSNRTTAAATTTLQSNGTTTAAATTLQSNRTTAAAATTLQSNRTTAAAATTLQSNRTTAAAATTLQSNRTTAAAATTLKNNRTTGAAATTLQSNRTTAAAPTTLQSNGTTAAAPITLQSNGTTAAAAITLQSNRTTAAAATRLQSNRTTAAAATRLQSNRTDTATTTQSTTGALTQSNSPPPTVPDNSTVPSKKVPSGNEDFRGSNKKRVAREISASVTSASELNATNGLIQGIEVSCDRKTEINHTQCVVLLQLTQTVPPCCILRTLCAASKASRDIHVVGNSADIIGRLDDCSSTLQEKGSCTYEGPASSSCEVSGAAYVQSHTNLTNCSQDVEKKNCSCSAYCNRTDAYYTFEMSVQVPQMNASYVLSLISKIKAPICSPSTNISCPLSTVASEYKDVNVTCTITATNRQSCRVILGFAREVPICNVSAAVISVFQSDERIHFNGLVMRAAICGNSNESGKPMTSAFTWYKSNLTPAEFCTTTETPNIFPCRNGSNVAVELDEQCILTLFTTASPNVTTMQPNASSTTASVNVTSSPLNTTAEPLNATTTGANVTVTATVNATTTSATAEGQANALLELTRDVSKLNSSQVDQLVSQLENLLSGPNVSLALGNTSVQIVSNLLDASSETLANSASRIVGIVDTVGLKLVLDKEAVTLLSLSVALSVKPEDGSNFQEIFFSISDPSNVQVRGDPRQRRSVRADSSIPQGSIRLPPSITQDLTPEQQLLASRVQFNFYQKSTVFQDRSLGQRKLNSGILGASVANLSISGLKDDVVIHLRNKEPIPDGFVTTCVFWDVTFNNGSGGWNPNGCSVQNSTDNMTICGCNHLTSFAILLDLSRETVTSALQATILTFITYIGCGISAIFLSITLLTYLAFGKLRKDIPSKILIQLCLALLLLNFVFLVDAWLALYPDAIGLCISTAWFLHYFLLVSFTWMGLEAVHMYLALVKVFNSHISHYMLRFSLVGWGVPMLVVIIVIAIDKDNYGIVSYGKFADGTTDDFCWLKNDIAFYVAVVAYFCAVFVFNLVMFVVVLVQLCRIKRQNPHNAQHRTTLQDVRSVLGITILLGLTWGFAFFAWGPVNLAFMYLFAIFNSLQGFFIFVFHCAVKENVRRQWRIYLCCGRMRLAENSEWSRTATQKNVKQQSSVTQLTSLNSSTSSQSNNSSRASLVNDPPEQTNGIGSPFEDRTITAEEDPNMDVVLNEINREYRTRPEVP